MDHYLRQFIRFLDGKDDLRSVTKALNTTLVFLINGRIEVFPIGKGVEVWTTDTVEWSGSMIYGIGETPYQAAEHLLKQLDGHPATIQPSVKTRYDVLLEEATNG